MVSPLELRLTALHCNEFARTRGFTLIELMVAVSVAAILMGIAIPSFRTFLQNDRLLTQANSLVWSLAAARSEAIKRDVAAGVSVCASSDGVTCNTNNWAQGWIVLAPASPAPVQVMPALSTGNTLKEKAAGLAQVTFLPSGQVTAAAAFTFCDDRGAQQARYVQVAFTGRVASASNGHDLANNALACP